MDRNREARRVNMTASTTTTSNGLARRRHRTNSLRDSPEEDGPLELSEPTRLRDRGVKKDRDRDRDRERSSSLSRSKRRRGERLMHSNREDGGDDSTEESVNDDEEEDDDDGGGGAIRTLPPNPPSLMSSSISNHHQFRKSFPPLTMCTTTSAAAASSVTVNKVFRAPVLKGADEMIGVSVPRKARSASTKRSHECWISSTCGGAGGGVSSEQNHRQPSTSPVRSNLAAAAAASPAPISPSSSNASIRKKMKPNGLKQHRPPKSSSTKSSSSIQEEIEIEVAEVLYGLMRQSQVPSKQEVNDSPKLESRDANTNTSLNKLNSSDAKSRVSSPISNSPSANPQPSLLISQNSSSSATAVAPKRKRPRPVKYEDETPSPNPPVPNVKNSSASVSSSMPKIEIEQQTTKFENSSPKIEKNSGSAVENGGGVARIPENPPLETTATTTTKAENLSVVVSDSKISSTVESDSKEVAGNKQETSSPPTKEFSAVRSADDGVQHHHHRVDSTATKAKSAVTENESHRETKFQIDLMAPPPPSKSSPERDVEIDFAPSDPKPLVSNVDTELRPISKEEEKTIKIGKTDSVEPEEKRLKLNVAAFPEEKEKKSSSSPLVKGIDLQLDLEKPDREHLSVSAPAPASVPAPSTVSSNSKSHQTLQKSKLPEPSTEKSAQSGSVPLSMSVAGWPGGLPPLGYMAPLQGVVSMDGGAVSSAPIQPPHLLFSQPRPKRCSTHRYIARNIAYHQQFTRMNPFWPAAAGTASLYGAKNCNRNVMAPAELAGRNMGSVQDKGQGLSIFPGHTGKDKAPSAVNIADAAQRKQLLVQQALPTGAPSNILQGPAFIFPLNQQQAAAAAAAAAASARPGSAKPLPNVGGAASSSAASGSISSAATGAAGTAMTFSYPNMPPNDTQYLAILQNNVYPFPIPAHVGAAPAYRGTHAQAMPFFNGPFYSSQMLHPSQSQQQQQHAQPQQQQQQNQQSHQNSSISGSSSSSQKHLQTQQQRPQGSAINGAATNLPTFPASKSQSSSTQQQQQQNHHIAQPRQTRLESEGGGEDSTLTAESRVPRPPMNVYSQNFALPIPPPNFLMTPPTVLSGASGGGANSEKKQQQPQQQSLKAGLDQLTPQTFAMSFASINNTAAAAPPPGLDISSVAQNHAILQCLPEAARHSYQILAAAAVAQAAQNKKNFRISEDSKSGVSDSSNAEDDRKSVAAKAPSNVGPSIAFSRSDFTDSSVSAIPGNTVIDSSARSLNLTPAANSRGSRSVLPGTIATVGPPNSQPQQQQQQQQMMQFQKQQQFAVAAAAAAARSKTPATSNGAVYTDHPPASSSMAAKFPNALSAFPQNLVQCSNSSSPSQSPQWKNAVRTITSQVPSTAIPSSTTSTLKNLPQQQGRPQQSQTQISFGGNPKSSTPSQSQPPPSSAQSPSPPIVVGSPTASSISKGIGGSPRTTTSTSAGNKPAQASSFTSSQQAKGSSPSVPTRKSSPVGQHQQQQQQQQKHSLQQATLFFNNSYMQPQAAHSPSTTSSATNAYYLQRRRPEQPQQQPGSSAATSSGVFSLCPPVTLASAATSDPAKAMAAATAAAAKGGVLPTPAILHAQFAPSSTQLMPAGFPYVHAVPTAVPVKTTEQKQPASE